MLLQFVILVVSIVVGAPLVAIGAVAALKLIAQMDAISTTSAWVGRVGMGAGLAVSVLIGAAMLVTGNGFFAPLATVSSLLFVELIVASQLRNGIKLWERRERAVKAIEGLSVMRQIEERLSAPNLPRIEKAALRLQRFILRSVGLGSIS